MNKHPRAMATTVAEVRGNLAQSTCINAYLEAGRIAAGRPSDTLDEKCICWKCTYKNDVTLLLDSAAFERSELIRYVAGRIVMNMGIAIKHPDKNVCLRALARIDVYEAWYLRLRDPKRMSISLV